MMKSYFMHTRSIIFPGIKQINVCQNNSEAAKHTAHLIISLVQQNPFLPITFATGDTMIPVYTELANAVLAGNVSFSETTAFHLDEYYPCNSSDTFSFVRYITEKVIAPLRITPSNTHTINGLATNPTTEANRYDDLVSRQPGLTLLGIGPGGHIGFNEPNTPFELRSHLTMLSPETIHRDHIERKQQTPVAGITQGIATILDADQIILTAYGERKGTYLKEALLGPISPTCPASSLRLVGEKVTIVIDQKAARSLLDD